MLKNKFINIKEAPKLFDKIYVVFYDENNNNNIVHELDIKYVEYFSEDDEIKYKAKNDNKYYVEFYLKFNEDNLVSLVSNVESLNDEDYFIDKNDAYFECSNRIQKDIDNMHTKIKELQNLQIEYKKQYENR